MNLTPYVIEQTPRGERSFDIYSRLLEDRIILIFGEINDLTSQSVIAQLLFLESVDNTKPIYIYINSPGGSVTSGFAIYDVMKYIKSSVHTIGMGICASLGAFLLSSGDYRYALENTKVMIHQPLGKTEGQASDMLIVANEIIKTKKRLNEILASNTKQPIDKIEQDTERDYYMSSNEAKEYGIIDEIITKAN
ncbi:MAG: ATP-dependent Clp protease proteolytic subunit [Bacilli bacterium]|nr:ATP-dependent Clp protease proteolytic subunit [Bacilli bacterium]